MIFACIISAFSSLGQASHLVGTYVETNLETGAVQKAVRVHRTAEDHLEADAWVDGVVHRLGIISADGKVQAESSEDWLERSLELRVAGLVFVAHAVRLDEDHVRRAFQHDPRVRNQSEGKVLFDEFDRGGYARPPKMNACPDALADDSGAGLRPNGRSGG